MNFDLDAFNRGVRDVLTLSPLRVWMWRLLPDKCQEPDCCRQGVRGNENIIDGRVVCDYCHAKRLREPVT